MAYHRYGGRGIRVCERWRLSFESFYADMGPRPSSHHSLDRIDNDGNYEPGNCRWSVQSEQARNKSVNHRLTYDGMTLTLIEWAERTGIGKSTLRMRIADGWSTEKALTTPVRVKRPNGEGRNYEWLQKKKTGGSLMCTSASHELIKCDKETFARETVRMPHRLHEEVVQELGGIRIWMRNCGRCASTLAMPVTCQSTLAEVIQ